MSHHKRPFELRNIKDNPDGYQIQFIVDGKSHSAFHKDLEKAKKIRDKMEKKLKLIPTRAFKQKASRFKTSAIPGTDKPMPSGISLRIHTRRKSETYEMQVNWRDHKGKSRIKIFYACTETRYTHKKMREAYNRALTFRKAYEKAVLDNTLKDFDHTQYTRSKAQTAKSKTNKSQRSSVIEKLRMKNRARRR